MCGPGATVNVRLALPPGDVSVRVPAPVAASVGIWVVTWLSVATKSTDSPLKDTEFTVARVAPLTLTSVPGGPLAGETPL
jgi:hypothetical protein